MTIDDGGQAFPSTITAGTDGGRIFPHEFSFRGMTYRQWLAGLAMQGILAGETVSSKSARDIAVDALELADLLIAELRNPTP